MLGYTPVDCRWYVIRAHHHQEARTAANLAAGNIETFLPWARPLSRRKSERPNGEPLFPQYLFARFDAQRSLHDVTFTRGVQRIVQIGGGLATIDDEVIAFFRSRGDAHGSIPIGRVLAAGERGTIEHGPFAALAGVVERVMPARQRVLVLLTAVGPGPALRVEVPTDHVYVPRSGLAC
jgi:transcription antitermination factor NusG